MSVLENGNEQIREYSSKMLQVMETTLASMRQKGDRESDPQEVADKNCQRTTETTPLHNIAGDDALGVAQMQQSMPEEELINTVTAMFIPECRQVYR